MKDHDLFMRECIALGKEALKKGNPPVGAIVINNNKVIGKGIELAKSDKDITKHAEIEAIRDALANHQSIKDTILYTTHEPCIMCSYVIRHHQIKTIVFGVKSKYVGGLSSVFKILETENVPSWNEIPEVIEGVLENECLALSTSYQSIHSKKNI